MHGWFCPICLIYLTGRKSLHFGVMTEHFVSFLVFLGSRTQITSCILKRPNNIMDRYGCIKSIIILQLLYIFTARERSCGKVMFSQACVKNSVHKGGCLTNTPWEDTPRANTPPGQTPHPWADTPYLGRHPIPGQIPPGQSSLAGRHPLDRHIPGQTHTLGRQLPSSTGWYVSYWNSFLLEQNIIFDGRGVFKRYYTGRHTFEAAALGSIQQVFYWYVRIMRAYGTAPVGVKITLRKINTKEL